MNREKKKDPGEIRSALEVAMERIARMEAESGAPPEATPPVEESAPDTATAALTELEARAEEYLAALQYKTAEFDNFRKRMRREMEEVVRRSVDAAELLDLMDNFDRTLAAAGEHTDLSAFVEALRLLHQQFESLLARRGIARVDSVGTPFDPNLHEAMAVQDAPEFEEGQVCGELSPLYMQNDSVLRPARVVVCKKDQT